MHAQDHRDWHAIAAAEGTPAWRCPFDCIDPQDDEEQFGPQTPAATSPAATATIHHVAKFHRAGWADKFAARIQEAGWTATNVTRSRGNIVTFDAATTDADDDGWTDWALTVGYYGSPSNPGTLDGRRAIACY